MFAIIGIITVLGAVVLGYVLEHGNFSVLWQPAELVIIFGAAFGSLVLGSPKEVVIGALKGIGGIFGSGKTSKAFFLDMLIMLSMLFMKIRREGLVAIKRTSRPRSPARYSPPSSRTSPTNSSWSSSATPCGCSPR